MAIFHLEITIYLKSSGSMKVGVVQISPGRLLSIDFVLVCEKRTRSNSNERIILRKLKKQLKTLQYNYRLKSFSDGPRYAW